ncbi:MAG TPA: pentapeptide repeat-containing protein [Candidatus Cybelea sp.]|nr:pentapeptide repeat-containing protein [Candidatus Cybelea sp.]
MWFRNSWRRHSALFGALVLALGVMGRSAVACTEPQAYDPSQSLRDHSAAEIVATPEVIVEGVVEPPEPSQAPDDGHFGLATMTIDKVWKGDVGPSVDLLFAMQSSDCTIPPPFGERIRFGATIVEKDRFRNDSAFTSTYPELVRLLATNRQVLLYPFYPQSLYLPLQDPELDPLLDAYNAKIDALKQKAESGGKQDRLAYAAFLQENHEAHRALDLYETVYRDNPDDLDLLLTLAVARTQAHRLGEPEATLAALEQKAPKTDEWRGKIARTRFASTGAFAPDWKDWSDLKPAVVACRSDNGDFDGASFDRADLSGCVFKSGMFRQASFRHADLSDAEIEDSVMKGATYDCATRFPDGFDPNAEEMVNVEGSCGVP